MRTIARTNAVLIGVNELVECRRVHISLFDEHAFQRPHPQIHLTDLAGMTSVDTSMAGPTHGRDYGYEMDPHNDARSDTR